MPDIHSACATENNEKELSNDYFHSAKSWYEERYESIVVTKNRYKVVSIGLGILLGLSILAIAIMMPLKTTTYRMIEVNTTTGEITDLKELDGLKYSSDWAVIHYLLNQYVQNRESYSFEEIKRKFNLTIAMSDSAIAESYVADTIDTNPQSPIKQLNDQYYRTVNIKGIDKLNDHTAIVKYDVETHNRNDLNDTVRKSWHAVINWKFVNKKESLEFRDKDPLGFKVTYFQREPIYTDK